MTEVSSAISLAIFLIVLVATFAAAIIGRRHAGGADAPLARQKLNRWWIGLSAGAAANSGFIVTGAVGLGYLYGLQWIWLPIAWLCGDLVYWKFFPGRINAYGARSGATTLSELLTHNLSGRIATLIALLVTAIVLLCLGGYVSAQWIAGQKFLSGAFAMPDFAALMLFAAIIIAYTSIGGFRGSVYVDALQAVIRIIGTALALGMVCFSAWQAGPQFMETLNAAGPDFWRMLPGQGIAGFIAFILGYAAAAIGFGLGQPQLVSRYLAGADPQETQSARWIYIGFLQFTWIAMSLFGTVLRGVMPGLEDPETGLSAYFQTHVNPVLTGIIVADVFATIAATSNAILVAMAQGITHDLWPRLRGAKPQKAMTYTIITLGIGFITMAASLVLHQGVVTLALTSVSLMGAALAGAVIVRIMNWPVTAMAILASILTGIAVACAWKFLGPGSDYPLETLLGILCSLAAYRLTMRNYY